MVAGVITLWLSTGHWLGWPGPLWLTTQTGISSRRNLSPPPDTPHIGFPVFCVLEMFTQIESSRQASRHWPLPVSSHNFPQNTQPWLGRKLCYLQRNGRNVDRSRLELGNVMRFMVRMTTIMDTFVIEKILICSLYCPSRWWAGLASGWFSAG